MTSRIHTQNQRTNKQTQDLLTTPVQAMFKARPFVVQTQTANQVQQPDLNTSLIQAKHYGHHLNQIDASVSKPEALQPKMETGPVQLAPKRKRDSATGGNSTGQLNKRRRRPNLTIDTNPTGKELYDKRNAAGYKNQSHDHKNMMPLYEKAAVSPQPPNRNKKDWLYSPSRRFETHTPTHTNPPRIVKGHTNTVMGHKPDAAQHWNDVGHKQSRKDNQEHNKQTSSYHGLEDSKASAASGSKTDRYGSPSPSIGSHPSHWDVTHPEFNPRVPWTKHLRQPDGKGGYEHVKYDPSKKQYVKKGMIDKVVEKFKGLLKKRKN